MRIRWARVLAAVAVLVGGVPALGIAGMWVTGPSPSPIERYTPGAEDCTTSEVLEAGLALYQPSEGIDESDRLAADILLRATGCRNVEEVDWERVFEVFELARDGLAWIGANEDGQIALDHALDVWELSSDQRRAGSLINVALWNAIGVQAGGIVEAHLYEEPLVEEARRRLVGIANAPVDWDEVHAREEQGTWPLLAKLVVIPEAWPEVLELAKVFVEGRLRTGPFPRELHDDVGLDRVQAGVLAGAAELAVALDGPDAACPPVLAVSSELADVGVVLTVDPDLCVVAGIRGDKIRMASPALPR